jgi:hypothetical protein
MYQLDDILSTKSKYAESVYAIAPVRSKPERTYNPVDDTPKAEGTHVPMVLARAYFTEQISWAKIAEAVDKFGKASGLFDKLTVRSLEKSDSDPFQIIIHKDGMASNLIDVGYGVSQVLPILAELFMREKSTIYLLQQPEVHLHHRGQAALGSFLGTLVHETKSIIIAEAHSDYIIDRIPIDIINSTSIKSDDVVILYFERKNSDCTVTPIFFIMTVI